jgi:hypothetical protein
VCETGASHIEADVDLYMGISISKDVTGFALKMDGMQI